MERVVSHLSFPSLSFCLHFFPFIPFSTFAFDISSLLCFLRISYAKFQYHHYQHQKSLLCMCDYVVWNGEVQEEAFVWCVPSHKRAPEHTPPATVQCSFTPSVVCDEVENSQHETRIRGENIVDYRLTTEFLSSH